jgi:ABC-type glycerol-3-phosphate transport system substrate-binding protein
MQHKHSLWKWIAVLTLGAILLTACGGTTPAPADTAVPGTPQVIVVSPTPGPEATVAPKPKGEITIWMWKPAMDPIINSGVEASFKEAYPDIKINWVVYGTNDVYQKLPLTLSAGTGAPDIALVEDSNLGAFVALGGLADLTDRVAPFKDQMNKYKWDAASLNGKVYAQPWDSGPVVMYYRRDVFKAAGLSDDPVEVSKQFATWDSYLAACKTIFEKTQTPCLMQNKANNDARLYEMMLWQQGLGYYNKDGKVTIDSAENAATLEKLGEFWKANNGKLVADEANWTDPWYGRFKSLELTKTVATHVEAAWMGGNFKTWIAAEAAGKWGVAEMPAMAAGQARSSNDGGSSFVIPDQSKNKDAAWAFVQFITTVVSSQNRIFAYSDIFPSYEPAYADALFSEPDSYFAGENVRAYYLKASKIVPTGYVYGQYYSMMHGYVQTAIQKFATGAASAADALKEAADNVRQQSGMP